MTEIILVPVPQPPTHGARGARTPTIVEVEAQLFGEFAVHRCIGYDGKPAFSFAVSHTPTGISIATGTHGHAVALAKKLQLRFPSIFAGLEFIPLRAALQAHADYAAVLAFVNREKKPVMGRKV